MGFSQNPTITDELLSAYVDDAVSASERLAVETAVANDSEVAWRLETLRNTVSLLGQLSDVPLPRSFALADISQTDDSLSTVVVPQPVDSSNSFLEKMLDFWRSGSPVWRNAAVVCSLLLLVVLLGELALMQETMSQSSQMLTMPQNVSSDMLAESAVISDESVEAPAMVAMAPAPPTIDQEAKTDSAADEGRQSISSVGVELDGDEQAHLLDESPSAIAGEVEVIEEVDDTEDQRPVAAAAMIVEPSQPTLLPVSPTGLLASDAVDSIAVTESVADMAVGPEARVDVPDSDLLIAASGLRGAEEPLADEGVESAPSTEVAEPVFVEPEAVESVADAVSPVEAEAPPQPMMRAGSGSAIEAPVEDAVETGMADSENFETDVEEFQSAEAGAPPAASAPEDIAGKIVTEEEVAQDVQSGKVEDTPPVDVAMAPSAMADGAVRADPAAARRPSSENLAELDSAELQLRSAGENGPNPTWLFGLIPLLLAILALLFFILWLRSRSRSTTISK